LQVEIDNRGGEPLKLIEKLTVEEAFEKMIEFGQEEQFRFEDELYVLLRKMPTVCPLSLTNVEMFEWLDIEEMSQAYKVLPIRGSIFNQPLIVKDIFSAILEGKAQYQSRYLADMKTKMENKHG